MDKIVPEKKLGLLIKYEPFESVIKPDPKKTPKYERIEFKIIVAEGVAPSSTFITSLEIRNALKKANLSQGSSFGLINFAYYPKKGLVVGLDFFPLPLDRSKVNLGELEPRSEFAKLGIARRIEAKVLRILKEKHPNTKYISFYRLSAPEKQRIKSLGFATKKRINFSKFNSAVRTKLAKRITSIRAKR